MQRIITALTAILNPQDEQTVKDAEAQLADILQAPLGQTLPDCVGLLATDTTDASLVLVIFTFLRRALQASPGRPLDGLRAQWEVTPPELRQQLRDSILKGLSVSDDGVRLAASPCMAAYLRLEPGDAWHAFALLVGQLSAADPSLLHSAVSTIRRVYDAQVLPVLDPSETDPILRVHLDFCYAQIGWPQESNPDLLAESVRSLAALILSAPGLFKEESDAGSLL